MNTICAVIKNETLYLKDWIEYNISIGFDKIHLYEDIGSCSHKEICEHYDCVSLESICVVNNAFRESFYAGCNRQNQLYSWFLRKYKNTYDWVAFIDIDEYITFDDGYNLNNLLEEFKEENGIILYWKLFGAGGNVFYEDKPIISRFTKEAELLEIDRGACFKSIVNMKKCSDVFLWIHEITYGLVNTRKMHTKKIQCYKYAWINHYFTKSWEEWCRRFLQRKDEQWGFRKLNDFFNVNKDMVKDQDYLMNLYTEWKEKNV